MTYDNVCELGPRYEREMSLIQCSVVQIICRDLGLKCLFRLPTRLLPIIISFSYICISQGSVATLLMLRGIFNNYFVADCPYSAAVKVF